MPRIHGLALVLAAAGAAGPLQAQPAARSAPGAVPAPPVAAGLPADARRGIWYGGGLGAGAGSLRCGICADEADGGTAGYLRVGATLTRALLLGVEGTGWQRSAGEGRRRLLALTGGAWWYPSERHGYYVRGGVGIARWRAWSEEEAVVTEALALTLGAGYEVRVNPSLSIVPFVAATGSADGALWLEERDGNVAFQRTRLPAGGHTLLVQIGIGLTRH